MPEKECESVFLVMSLGTMDLKEFLDGESVTQMNEDHVLTIFYNMLCTVSYLHSFNLIHRDLKPANFLINDQCGVLLCDFGLARADTDKSKAEIDVEAYRKKTYLEVIKSSGEERKSRE